MIKREMMKKKAIFLMKPSGTVAIGGDLSIIQRKFYDGLLYAAQKTIEKDVNARWFEISLKDLKELLNTSEQDKNNKYYKTSSNRKRKV